MGFDKLYPNRKDWRKQYFKTALRVDASCRPHGGCDWELGNRMHKLTQKKLDAIEQITDFENDPDFVDTSLFAELGPDLSAEEDPMQPDSYIFDSEDWIEIRKMLNKYKDLAKNL